MTGLGLGMSHKWWNNRGSIPKLSRSTLTRSSLLQNLRRYNAQLR